MTSTSDFSTIVPGDDLPLELRRVNGLHQGEEMKIAAMFSGVISPRQRDEVICPYMLRRNLVVPAHQGAMAQSAWRVR